MATLRSAVKALLAADTTLMATLTGGVYDRRGINRTLTPAAYSSTTGALLPCAVITQEATAPKGDAEFDFETIYFQVWLYEEEGNAYAAIDVARDRVRALLHRQVVTISAGGIHEIRHVEGMGDFVDETLNAEASFERFLAWRKRA